MWPPAATLQPGETGSPGHGTVREEMPLRLARAEHALCPLDLGSQPLLEVLVLLALGDVCTYCGADDLGYGLRAADTRGAHPPAG
jgi:hypothetical protein